MKLARHKISSAIFTLLALNYAVFCQAEEELLMIDDEDSELLIMDEGDEIELVITDDLSDEMLILDEDADADAINEDFDEPIDDNLELLISEETDEEDSPALYASAAPSESSSAPSLKMDRVWVEYGQFVQGHSGKNNQGYGHGLAVFEWSPSPQWEIKASARADGYFESGRDDWDDVDLDYDETYIRYKGENSTVTLGAQKILWGRIDEFPPTDRLSTQDLRRFVLDDLEDRRLASPALRVEHFFDNKKLDMVFYPDFREAQLPDKDSTWYPVNRRSGEILSLKTSAAIEAVAKTAPVQENTPDSEGGFGLRFSSISSTLDYALTLQKGRQTLPYFSYNPATNAIEGRYPRTWIIGGDMGFEALGGTVKFEATWLSDTPVTRTDGSYTTVKSVNWGAALELFPGDGDSRLNLQLTGSKLMRAPRVIDRGAEAYTFNGSYEVPFDNNRWRAKTRFYVGLDEKDLYINPEIAFTGWESQELYLELHFFDGDKGTPGGFYQDNSIVTLGWRISF